MLTLAFKSAGNVTSMFPFNELKAMAFCGSTFVNVAFKCPFKACATALPETLFSVTEPFTSSTSRSPSTPVTTMSPSFTARSFSAANDGDIVVTGVDGDLDVDDVNGSVTLNNVSGSAVAHALNGHLNATFTKVDPQKAMAFSSLNGNIDVTFPADLKANVSIRSDQGNVFSDFDVQLKAASSQPVVEDGRGHGGKYRVKIDKTVHGTINGGGPEIQFRNFQGQIYIRKAGNPR